MDLNFYTNFAQNVGQQEAAINTLQAQVASGYAVQTPDQGPAAYETASFANDQIGQISADNTTQAAIQNQLGSVGGLLTSVSNLFDNVQSVAEQALNGATNSSDQQELSTQVSSSLSQLIGLANTTGSNGQYLFGGSRGNIAPFQVQSDGSVLYIGDNAQSLANIAPGTSVPTISNGEVFVSSLNGDGIANVTAASSNTGSAGLTGVVINPVTSAAFQQGSTPITVSFSQGANGVVYTAAAGGNVISTGNVTSGLTLQLAGEEFTLSGSPAAGDQFTIAPARPTTAFALLQTIATALADTGNTPAQGAQTRQILNTSLGALAQYQQAVVTAQAQNGVTLQAVSNAKTGNASQSNALQGAVQTAVGANIPVAIDNLDQSVTALEAAFKAFASASSLSLFQYL
jgi:flagellar hook-associated protein 3 FlgL